MKRLFLLSLLLLIVCCARHGDSDVRDRLEKWDAEIWNRPYVYGDTLPLNILDSLGTIDSKRLSKKDEAHYNLLWTIAKDKSNFVFEDDSVISRSVAYYQRTEDYRNYSRSLLYKGLVRYRINTSDTTIYPLLKKAEEVYDVNHCKDERLIAITYTYLGAVNAQYDNYDRDLEYKRKAEPFFTALKDTNNMLLTQSDIVFDLLLFERFDDAKSVLDSMSRYHRTASADVNIPVNSAFSAYYECLKDYNKALQYKKRDIQDLSGENQVPIYYSIANLYSKLNEKDSTMKYINLLSESLEQMPNVNEHRYFKIISNIYLSLGYPNYSAEYLERAYSSLKKYEEKAYKDKVLEMEERYDDFEKEVTIRQLKQNNFTFILLIMVLLFAVILVYRSVRVIKKEKKVMAITKDLTNKLLFLSCKIIPSLYGVIDKLYKQNDSKESYNEYKKIRSSINLKFKKGISEIINDSDSDTSMFFDDSNPKFTTYEKAVFFLLNDGYSKEKIASILNSDLCSIRTIASKINNKIDKNSTDNSKESK